jgi:hypothetical protein
MQIPVRTYQFRSTNFLVSRNRAVIRENYTFRRTVTSTSRIDATKRKRCAYAAVNRIIPQQNASRSHAAVFCLPREYRNRFASRRHRTPAGAWLPNVTRRLPSTTRYAWRKQWRLPSAIGCKASTTTRGSFCARPTTRATALGARSCWPISISWRAGRPRSRARQTRGGRAIVGSTAQRTMSAQNATDAVTNNR